MDTIATKGRQALRPGRVSTPGQAYLLTTTTESRAPLFEDFDIAAATCRALHAHAREGGLEPLCWVLMPDHLHLLATLRRGRLTAVVGDLKARLARAANVARGTTRPVWQRGFHDSALRHEEDLLDTARYLVANPVRAGLVRSVRFYPYWYAAWM